MIKQAGNLCGAGAKLYFESAPDIKFSLKNFKQELNNNSQLQIAFAKECKKILEPMLSDTENQSKNKEMTFDLNALINSIDLDSAVA